MRPAWLCLLLGCTLLATPLRARADATSREAGKHFQRGVDLYNDGDFRGALVEFKRAYALLPRASVLYDIGETEFQLQDYAAALTTMRRFLAETGASAPHRGEVEATVETLRGRVGRIAVTTDVPRCDVTLDEQVIGQTPLGEPVLASVGPRKVTVACADRPPAVRRVDVTAGELARVDVAVGAPTAAQARPPGLALASARPAPDPRHQRVARLAITWSSTAILAAATVAVGSAALVESSHLSSLRQSYPAAAAELERKGALTRGLSIAADALGAAALVAIGVSTYVTVKERRAPPRVLGLGLGPASASLRGTF